jgi:hypothetical protein
VRIIGEQSVQHHKEDGKRATEGVNNAAAAKKAKTSTISTELQSFVSQFNPAPAKHSFVLCVYVCDEKYIYMYPFSLGVRGVRVCCGYEDRINFGRMLEEL